jgi:hypothetical protein
MKVVLPRSTRLLPWATTITLGVYLPEQGAVGAVLRTSNRPGTSVIRLSEGPMNQAILFANSALKSCIDRVAGAPECLPFMVILLVFSH